VAVRQTLRAWRTQPAVIPDQLAWRHFAFSRSSSGHALHVAVVRLDRGGTRRVTVGDHRAEGEGILVHPGRCGLDHGRSAELESAEHRIHRVAPDIPQRASAEVPPTAPAERRVNGVVGASRGGSQPEVPFESIRNCGSIFGTGHALGPILIEQAPRGPIRPDVRFPHRADDSSPHQLA